MWLWIVVVTTVLAGVGAFPFARALRRRAAALQAEVSLLTRNAAALTAESSRLKSGPRGAQRIPGTAATNA